MRYFILVIFIIPFLSFSQQNVSEEKITRLNGEWKLVLGKFLSYEEVLNTEGYPVYVPGKWNGVPFNDDKFSGMGYGTYFKTIKLPNHNGSFMIYMPPVGLAYSIYANSKFLGQVGQQGIDLAQEIPKIKTETYLFPKELNGKEVTIILHVSNFSHRNGGMWYAPEIGRADYYIDTHLQRTIANMLVLGSIFIIMCYHLFLYILRPKEKYSLYFSMTCLCLLVHAMSQGDVTILYLFPETPWHIVLKMAYVTLFTIGAFNLLFTRALYPQLVSKKINKIVGYISLIAGLFGIIASPKISNYLVFPYQILTVCIGLYLVAVMVIAAKRNLNGARILLVGYSITFLTAIHDVLNSQFIIESTPAIQYGVFIYVLTLSMVLAKKFTHSINVNERLRFELNELNNDLEARVKSRTSELQNQKELVANQNEELNQIMAMLAHDLKSPLLNINSLSQMMVRQSRGELEASSQIMQRIAKEGVGMIDSLVSLKKLENEDINVKPVDLTQLINLKVAEFMPRAEQKDQQIRTDILDNLIIDSRARHLNKIFENLLSNAIKFSPIGAVTKVTVNQRGNNVNIRIMDEGPGFTLADKEKIFQKFHRLSASPTSGESSSGLGLSIVKTLVNKLGGTIQLESEVGKGTEFILTFPS